MIKRNPKEIEASRIWREKDPGWIAKHRDTWEMAEGAYRQALLWEVINGEADGEAERVILRSMMSNLEFAKYVMQESRGQIGRGGFGPMYIDEAKATISQARGTRAKSKRAKA